MKETAKKYLNEWEVSPFETNFVIKKFLELPIERQREIWEQVNSDDLNQRNEGGNALMSLLFNDLEGMSRFAHEAAGFEPSDDGSWLVVQVPHKTTYIFAYFLVNLKCEDGQFKIESIPW